MTTKFDYSAEVLEEAPIRATKFLQGMGAVPIVRTLLAEAGMREDDIEEGRNLLLACIAAPRRRQVDTDTEDARAQRAAVTELDQWDEPNFARFGAALKRRFRSAHEYVFADLKASQGAEAVNGVATFLARVDALESGSDPARSATRKDDAKAVALLESRGLTKAERKRLAKLVASALGPTSPLAEIPAQEPDEERLQRLSALRGWFDEWSETARAVVKKRSYLIRLGLATRKVGKGTTEPEPPDESAHGN